jgi:hypothetical protein
MRATPLWASPAGRPTIPFPEEFELVDGGHDKYNKTIKLQSLIGVS